MISEHKQPSASKIIALAQPAKKIIVDEKTGKTKRKKRFGKSIAHRAPAMFLAIVRQKLAYHEIELKEKLK
ncbi:hypothetical protein [Aneurinibacillus migulanus]|uniref:hypothetical protein n=1 Tax=Aneurinibacillus migulanus TaxID=47500 RepID=UPI00209F9A8E|nr:hypothetical protein [Aneurinibacillus migulanus]MCP1355814.1 hypothetical protein [Aneurinibacillus migulanus]